MLQGIDYVSPNDITKWLWLGIIRFKVGIRRGSHGVSLNLLLSVRSHVARENNATSKSTWKNRKWMMLMDKGRLEWWWDEVTCYPQIKIIYLKRIFSMSGNGKIGQHETINPWWEMEKKEINESMTPSKIICFAKHAIFDQELIWCELGWSCLQFGLVFGLEFGWD